jgi:hypothetical protein
MKMDRPFEVDPSRTYSARFNENYAKYLNLKETLALNDKQSQKKRQSNGSAINEKRDSDLLGLQISMPVQNPVIARLSARTANPLTSRREKPPSVLDFEIMPEN